MEKAGTTRRFSRGEAERVGDKSSQQVRCNRTIRIWDVSEAAGCVKQRGVKEEVLFWHLDDLIPDIIRQGGPN